MTLLGSITCPRLHMVSAISDYLFFFFFFFWVNCVGLKWADISSVPNVNVRPANSKMHCPLAKAVHGYVCYWSTILIYI